MARKPIAPGANGRRNSSMACPWVRAGAIAPGAVGVARSGLGIGASLVSGDSSGGEGRGVVGEARFGEEAAGAAGAAVRAGGGGGGDEPVLGPGGGDVEQPAFLLQAGGVGG